MKVLKFGGTSVGSPEIIRGVKKIIESQSSHCVTVVSAFQGVTDELKHISELASCRNDDYKLLLDKIAHKHTGFIKHLIINNKQEELIGSIKNILDEVKETLKGIYLLRELSNHSLDQVLSVGEIKIGRASCRER